MKRRVWRKILATVLSLLIVSGSIPVQPLSGLFGSAVMVYAAEEELVGYGETWSIIVDENIEHGIVETSVDQAEPGDTVTLTPIPDEGYFLAQWYVTDELGNELEVSDGTFYMPDSSVTVSAVFGPQTLSLGENLMVGITNDTIEYSFTPTQSGTYHFIDEGGYYGSRSFELYDGNDQVASWSGGYNADNGNPNGYSVFLNANTTYIFSLSISTSANFKLIVGTPANEISVAEGIEHGIVEVSSAFADEYETISLTATPDEGYYLAQWYVTDESGNQVEVFDNTFYMPDSSVTVSAVFGPQTLSLGENLMIGITDDTIEYSFTPTQNGTYHFIDEGGTYWTRSFELYDGNDQVASWNGGYNADNGYPNGYSVFLNANTTYIFSLSISTSANFKLIVGTPANEISVAEGIEHGIVEVSSAFADEYETISLTATPDEGYYLAQWYVTDESGNEVEVRNNEFSMPDSSVTVSAEFGSQTLSLGENLMVGITDDTIEYSFTPTQSGTYHFFDEGGTYWYRSFELYDENDQVASWSGGYNADNGYANGYSVFLNANTTYIFRLSTSTSLNFKLTIATSYSITEDVNIDHGSVQTSVRYADAYEVVTLTANPDNGYYLSKWVVETENGESVTILSDNTFYMPADNVIVSGVFVEPVLHLGENSLVSLESDEALIYSFIPTKKGFYHFYSENADSNVKGAVLYDNDELSIDYQNNAFDIHAELEADTIYYLEIDTYNPTNFSVQVTAPVYEILIDGNTEHGTIEASADLADEDTEIRLTAHCDEGYLLSKWIVTDSEGNDIEVINDSFQMPKDNVNVSAVFAEPVLVLGENQIMTQNGAEATEYTFIPANSGKYNFHTISDVGSFDGYLKINGEDDNLTYNQLDYGSNYSFDVILTAGKEYTFGILDGDERNIQCIVVIEDAELPEIFLGEVSVTTKKNNWVEYGFCPEVDGLYRFYSNARYDPMAEIYGEGWEYIAGGDNENEDGRNFRFVANLKANNYYILRAREANNKQYTISVNIEIAGYQVSVDDNLVNGTIDAPDDFVEEGTTVSLSATPDSEYYFYRWIVLDETGEEISVTDNTFTMPRCNVTVSAEFVTKPSAIYVGENILPSFASTQQQYTFTAEDDGVYRFYSTGDGIGDPRAWLLRYNNTEINSDDDSGGDWNFDFSAELTAGKNYKFKIYSRQDRCYKVIVEAPQHHIAVDEHIEHGQVTASVNNAAKGDLIYLDVTADTGFEVKSVSVNGIEISAGDNGYSFVMPGEDVFVTAEFEEINLNPTFNHSCSFDNNITLNYYLPTAALEGYDNYRLEIEKQVFNEDGTSYTMDTYELTDYSDRISGGINYKVFSFSNIAAKEMGDEVRATLYADRDGATYSSPVDVYSVKQYALNRLDKSTDGYFKTLLVDMLNYGTAAQAYFNYNTSHLANADLTAEQQALGTSTMPELISVDNKIIRDGATAHFYAKSMVFDSSVVMKYYITLDAGTPMDNLKLVLSYTSIDGTPYTTTIPASDFGYESRYNAYTAKLTTIAAKDMGCKVTARIFDGDTEIGDVLEYSIESYALNRLERSSDEVFKELIREMMKYGKSAEAYFRNKNQ